MASSLARRVLAAMLPASVRWRMESLLGRLDSLEQLAADQSVRIRHLELALRTLIASPVYTPDPAVGFNGQSARKQLVDEILAAMDFAALVETGTWTGNTAGYLAATGLPVLTVERNPLYHALAQRRLAGVRNVRLANRDSQPFLRELADDAVYPSTAETGRRRGCVVRTRRGQLADRLDRVPGLRPSASTG